jgi:hypothetical protein
MLIVLGFSLAGGSRGGTDVLSWGSVITGAAMLAVFASRSWGAPHPLLRIGVVRAPAMAAGLPSLMLFAAGYFGSAVIGPAYVQIVRGDSATLTGLISVPQAAATGISLQIASRLIDRIQPRTVIGTGIAVAVAGTAARVAVLNPHMSYTVIMILGAVTGMGIGATLSPLMTAASRSLSGDDLVAGSSLLSLGSQSAVAIGTALISTLLPGSSASTHPTSAPVAAAQQPISTGRRGQPTRPRSAMPYKSHWPAPARSCSLPG